MKMLQKKKNGGKLTNREREKIKRKAKKDKKKKKNSVHRKYKDNPLASFTYDQARGRWVWVEVSSAKSNKRYVTAIANSRSYLDKVVKRIK